MTISRLDHFTLRTAQLEATKDFFVEVAQLRVGPRPAFAFPGYWLYQDDVALVHLAGESHAGGLDEYLGTRRGGVGGAVDHIAFRCRDLPRFEARLRRLRIACRPRTVPDLREHQVFVTEPNGVVIEFIFDSSEAASWSADAVGIATSSFPSP